MFHTPQEVIEEIASITKEFLDDPDFRAQIYGIFSADKYIIFTGNNGYYLSQNALKGLMCEKEVFNKFGKEILRDLKTLFIIYKRDKHVRYLNEVLHNLPQ